jgi:hypothetical protein
VIVHGPTDDEVEQAVERMVKPGVDSLHLSTAVASLSWKALIGRPGCPPGNSHREMSQASAGIVALTWSLGGHPHRHPSQVLPGRLNSRDEVFGTRSMPSPDGIVTMPRYELRPVSRSARAAASP